MLRLCDLSLVRIALFSFVIFYGGYTVESQALKRSESEATTEIPRIRSVAAIVVDLGSGRVLYERDADAVRPIASISKLMGALVVREQCALPLEGMHEMTHANRDAARGGDKTKLTTGWSFSHGDLFRAAIMRSDNRALPALGEACGLDPLALGVKMTAKARQLGLKQTFFREPNGLSAENVSTSREVLVFLKEAMRDSFLAEIMATQETTITGHKGERSRSISIRNTDRLLAKNIAQIIGGKTGYTDLAQYCLTVAARMSDQRELGMVFLGAVGRATRFADFTRVINWLYPQGHAKKSKTIAGLDAQPALQEGAPAKAMGFAPAWPSSDAQSAKEPQRTLMHDAAPAVQAWWQNPADLSLLLGR